MPLRGLMRRSFKFSGEWKEILHGIAKRATSSSKAEIKNNHIRGFIKRELRELHDCEEPRAIDTFEPVASKRKFCDAQVRPLIVIVTLCPPTSVLPIIIHA